MTNSWVSDPQADLSAQQARASAIAIGIDQYQHFQPLSYAQRDAQALRDFWVGEAGFAPERVLLFTDTSPAIAQVATLPSRDNLQSGIAQLCQQLQTDDWLWVFFSGYGMRFEGQDYLMPIESDPHQVATTGMAIATLFSILKGAATDNILLVLDMSRSQGAVAGEALGEQTIALANESGIPLILSCQPGEFSHETLALRQGLFTAALLEGLRYQGCRTLEHLVQFLGDRLPELSEHHWRPPQHPLAIIPVEKRYQLILPEKISVAAGTSQPDTVFAGDRSDISQPSISSARPLPATPPIGISDRGVAQTQITPPTAGIPNGFSTGTSGLVSDKTSKAVVPVQPVSSPDVPIAEPGDYSFWRRLLIWGGAIVLLLLLGVLLRNWAEFTKTPVEPSLSPNPGQSPADNPAAPQPSTPQPSTPVGQSSPATSSPLPEVSQAATPAPIPAAPISAPPVSAPPTSVTPIPPMQATSPIPQAATSVRPAAPSNSPSALDRVRAGLDRAIATTPSTQVSAFSSAIAQARQIPASDPLYAQAQQDIDRWSRVILSVAEQRASQENGGSRRRAVRHYRSAIDAAELVPRDRSVLRGRAQRLIVFWRQKIRDLGYYE